jgi:hypothetical protein
MDDTADGRDNPLVARYTFPAFNNASTTRYVVLWDLQRQCLESGADLSGAMAATIERLAGEGWQAEGSAKYGFVFIRRGTKRRLVMITECDPYNTAPKSFSPFRD